MRKNLIWIIFLLIIFFMAVWFIFSAAFAITDYYQYSIQVPTKIEKLEVKEIKADQFAVLADFSYEYEGKTYRGSGKVGSYYPNPWAADKAQKQYASMQWPAWIKSKHPEKAVLEKNFPVKRTVSAAILLCLLIYFAILTAYVRVKHGSG